ncbi:4'-phosphopantetheinyl transferase family protein [Streptomyces rubradiris]|uniref:4'-phosphopantetheinyl transferase domain-containing protein n=1 Tax=Streptomyces rubradiris TaxID=285531 RepID=A0ABQ3RB21_STRRR|nr:4'-phosphopantetheinyl transferase superfamily protein [Streptomyces rubradiris]GHH19274.1 hypothetical protein GCM10018792_51880 [Streptomyces rubradiris]GHI53054.1 hypothetical protein Srubr_29000 [Streptomyces rubradiris]
MYSGGRCFLSGDSACFTDPEPEFWSKRRISESDDGRLNRRRWFTRLTASSGDGTLSVADFRDRATTMMSIGRHQRMELGDEFTDDELKPVTSRAAQRLVAHRYTGRPARDLRTERTCPRCGAGHGRPRIVHGGYDHSVTHTRHRVLIAVVAQGLVGIDLDTSPYPGVLRRLIARTATPGERAALSRLPAREVAEAFTRLWARKEAVVKLTGHGLAARLDRIEVGGDLARSEGSPAEDWPAFPIHLRDVRVEGGRIAAIASTRRITAVAPRSLSAPATTRNTRFA